jgi:antitoxin component YwqK of YwqJK toxin-antitoxin module
MNKGYFTLILFIVSSNVLFGQKLTLGDLANFCSKKNWEDVNLALNSKDWAYYESEKGSNNKYNTITWSFNKDYYSEKANGWFYLYTYEGYPNKVGYSVFNKESFAIIQNSISSAGFKLTESEIEDDEIISTYSNSNYTLEIRTEKRENDDDDYDSHSFTAYNITLIKKSGVYDTENGKKTDYYYGDVVQAEYTLSNGKMEGLLKVYYSNGNLKRTGFYSKGKQNGIFKEYDESGALVSEYTMSNGEFNGPSKDYHLNGKIKNIEFYVNGKEQGHFIQYDESGVILSDYELANGLRNGVTKLYVNGKIDVSTTFKDNVKNGERVEFYYDEETEELQFKLIENYMNGLKNGKSQFLIIEKDNKERVLTFENYVADIKNGPFQEVKGDSLIIGNYKADKLDGAYKVYVDLTRLFLGGVIHTDVKDLKLLEDGNYSAGIKSGYWKIYDLSDALRNEGRFVNGLESGIWKYYYTTYANPGKGDLPYSRELFLEQTYSNGVLEGRSLRYSYLDEERMPCSELDETKNPLDTCKIDVYKRIRETSFYKNGVLYGPYELRDSTDLIITKGNFIEGIEEGEWLHRYTGIDENNNEYFIFQKGQYTKGKREGNWIQYYTEGKIAKTFQYNNGELNGEWIDFNELNRPRSKKLFRKGKLYELTSYDSLGQRVVSKYEIFDENKTVYKCRKTDYSTDGSFVSQEYRMPADEQVDASIFEFIFNINISERFDGKGFKDGAFKSYNAAGQLLTEGFFYRKNRIGLWTNFYYDQSVKIESVFSDGNLVSEKYLNLNGELYSGEFIFRDELNHLTEIRKVKKGLRNGKTLIRDANTNKDIRKETYKNGILQD